MGWRYYLLSIILTFIGGIVIWFYFSDTRGLPLEEISAIFGDLDEVAIYQAEIEVDRTTHTIIDHHNYFSDGKVQGTYIEELKA